MGIINVLDQQTVNLISAGEVVERPASVIKELLENAVDAGATAVTVEIKAGGSAYMRVSDNGKGMSREDVLICVKKHATSKIKCSDDLDSIITLGFRGEALAAISSVSKFEIVSKRRDDIIGTRLEIHGDEKISEQEIGCPEGTSVTVCDLFFNLPARRKFLKKPATETGVISQYVEKIALSHPEIAFKYIADGSIKFQTPGDSKLASAIYSIYGREFASGITEVSHEENGIEVSGYISKPEFSKNNRNYQTCFVNNRYVRAKSVMFGVDDAYKNYILSDKHSCYVLFCKVDPHTIDVNVHPAKLEIKFSDEKAIYSAVYSAVLMTLRNLKNPIAAGQPLSEPPRQDSDSIRIIPKNETTPSEKAVPDSANRIRTEQNTYKMVQSPSDSPISFKEFSEIFKIEEYKPAESELKATVPENVAEFKSAQPVGILRTRYIPENPGGNIINQVSEKNEVPQKTESAQEIISPKDSTETHITTESSDIPQETDIPKLEGTVSPYRIVGEIFNTYVLVESDDGLVMVDKHAAHERILYEELKLSSKNDAIQMLMVPVVIELDRKTSEYAEDFIPQITKAGFEIESFGDNTFTVRSVPAMLSGISSDDITEIVTSMALNVADSKKALMTVEHIFDDILHTAACKAAIKAKRHYDEKEIEYLIKRLYEIGNITYCPHGRPVCKIFTKKELDKFFFRT
ncbi:MAG: DNA mismatch repair endonuclease MutL [Ruminococcaceae bacterium]|nr:DNA mismatch repair endonuclease MutL [Oscillospiraceae bacterium]